MRIPVSDTALREAAEEGMDAFLGVFVQAIDEATGGELNADTMPRLNAQQITLKAYCVLRDEVMDGGFVQLIHNGWGPFFFRNPFDKAVRAWGLPDLCALMRKAHKLYNAHHADIERDCTDDEFMALFERFEEFDDCDDTFVENEEQWTRQVAEYVDQHVGEFAEITTT